MVLSYFFSKGDVQMIEADIIWGNVSNSAGPSEPVMGHPPSNESDISLRTFLNTILEFNKNSKNKTKGVKLDFKSTKVFEQSLPLLIGLWGSVSIIFA